MLRDNVNCQTSSEFQEVLSALNGRNTAMQTKNITKSFRLDEVIVAKIDEQARNNNTSLNAEINNILRRYVDWDMLANKVGMIPIDRPILSKIFQNIMTKEQVIELANNVAKNVILEAARFMKGSLTLESFLSWLKTRMEHCSEVNYVIDDNNTAREIRIIFKHELGENWSLYHKIVTIHIFKKVLHITNIEAETSNTMLTLCFKY